MYPRGRYTPSPPRRGWRLIWFLAWLATGLTLLPAADGPRRSYQLPAGDASRTLQEFSAASGREILFAANAIRGVQTRAVQGDYTELGALSAMLEGTPLFAMEDMPTGALAVRRRVTLPPVPAGPPSASTPPPSRTPASAPTAPTDPPPMPRKGLLALLSSWLLAPIASAAEPPAATVSEPAIKLSPFEIRSDRDTGFIATSALTGGRLATDLRDTPVAYSIVTKDFITALGITDIGEAAQWSTGNFPIIDAGVGLISANPIQYTTRGFTSFGGTNGGSKPQRNFFPQFNNSDSYNLDRYEFGRGPNSILFGNGTLGGIPSSTTIRAKTDRAFQEVSLGYGSWSNQRATLDINQPLNNRLAVRTALVWQDSGGWRMRDFDKRKGGFLTATLKPFKDTEIRLDLEHIRTSKQSGYTNISDVISGWDGVTTFNAAVPLLNPLPDLDQRGIFRITTPVYMYYPNGPHNGIVNIQYQSQTRQGGATPLTPYAGYTQGSLPAFGTTNAPILHADHYVPANRFAKAIAGSFFRPFSDDFTTVPDIPALSQRFRDIQLAVSQRVGESIFLEVAADVNQDQIFGTGHIQNRGMTNILIDINRVFPTGIPNPNFLQPYVEGNAVSRMNYTFSFYSVRGAAAYIMKPTRFGTFSFNLMGGGTRAVRDQDFRALSMATAPDPREWGLLNNSIVQNIRYRYYLNQPHRPLPDLGNRTVSYYDPVTGITKDVRPIWAVGTDRVDTQATDISETKYALAAGNAKFFKDRLVVLGALRKDFYNFRVHRTLDIGDYPADWNGLVRIHRPEAPADYHTLMYQPRNRDGTPSGPMREAANRPRIGALRDRDPLYVNDRFKDDYNVPVVKGNHLSRSVGAVAHVAPWFNPFFNYAETFNPPDGTVRINNQSRGPTEAWGRDYGVRLELFNQRLNISALKYEGSEDNAIEFTAIPTFNSLFNANVVGDQSLTGRNIRSMADLPSTYRDSRSRLSEGYEFEVVWNPLRGFRMTANYARPKVGFGNRFPDVLAFIATNRDVFKQIARDAGVIIDANDNAREDTSIPPGNRSPDVAVAASTYNAIVTFEKTYSGNAPSIGENPRNANFYADYTFQRGFLRDFRVGAGVQWRGRIARGNRGADTIVDPTNPARAIDDPAVSTTDLIYAPSYHLVTATMGYTWKLKDRRELQANLVVNNLLNDRDVMYLGTNLAPRGGDYTSPARQAVLGGNFQFKQPISYNLRLTMKL